MSLPVTLLLLFAAMGSSVLSIRTYRGFTGDNAFYGLLGGFIVAVASTFIVDLHDPNSGPAILTGLATAFIATPVVMTVIHFVQRVLNTRR